jgi:hypothetical protein
MADALLTLLQQVHNEATFVRFVAALGRDWEKQSRGLSRRQRSAGIPSR